MRNCLSSLPEIKLMIHGARRILIASDFDGTLCSISASPSDVCVAPATLEILRQTIAADGLTLAVISGRALSDVRSRLPLNITFAGNHGLEIAGDGLAFEHAGARQLRPALGAACQVLKDALREWPAAWIEDKGLSATLHFRKVKERHHKAVLLAARRSLQPFGSQLALGLGNRALEVRPNVAWDKGYALRYIWEKAGPFDASICIGDDRTDETMFHANRGQLNIRIGCYGVTDATHYLSDSTEVAVFLSHLINFRRLETLPIRTERPSSSWASGGD